MTFESVKNELVKEGLTIYKELVEMHTRNNGENSFPSDVQLVNYLMGFFDNIDDKGKHLTEKQAIWLLFEIQKTLENGGSL